jgi:hypothetical protein
MQKKHFLLTAFMVLTTALSWTATQTALSCSYTDVNNAVAAASDGDTVTIPSGTATWSSTLTISKAIVLSGAGLYSTVITAGSSGTCIIRIQPTSNKAIRVTGMGFVNGTYQVFIAGATNGAYVLDQVRIDHCSFTDGKDNLTSWGWVEGLIDHNFFLNGNRDLYVIGDNDYAWKRTITTGTQHALFIEDNTFKQTNAGGGGLNENIYHFGGGRTVIRYNDFDSSEYTSYDACLIDSHGEQPYWVGDGTSDRGQPLIEMYNNTFRYHHTYRVCYYRGGSVVMHDNQFTYVTSSVEIVLSEEEDWQTAVWSPLRTIWPAQDQIMNSFFWNNTRNGVQITDVELANSNDTPFIQKNRDYFMHEPQSAGGYEYFTGTRQGGSSTPPTSSDPGGMAFSATGANAYYPYGMYTYPHPLQGGAAATSPDAPKKLRLK